MMNLVSFVDELVKVGAMKCLYKRADDGDVNTTDIPHTMMSSDPMPEAIRVSPSQVGTRLPLTAGGPAAVIAGMLGPVTQSRHPIDRERFNRVYKDRR